MPKYKLCINEVPSVEFKKIEELDNFLLKYKIHNATELGNLYNVGEYENYNFTIEYRRETLKTLPVLFYSDIVELRSIISGNVYEYVYNKIRSDENLEQEFIRKYIEPITHIEIHKASSEPNSRSIEYKPYDHQKEMISIAKDIVSDRYDFDKFKRFLMFNINELSSINHQYQFNYKKVRDMYAMLKYYDKKLPNTTIIAKEEEEILPLDSFDEEILHHFDDGIRITKWDISGKKISSMPYSEYLERQLDIIDSSAIEEDIKQKTKNYH